MYRIKRMILKKDQRINILTTLQQEYISFKDLKLKLAYCDPTVCSLTQLKHTDLCYDAAQRP